jgi:hypothetical protein
MTESKTDSTPDDLDVVQDAATLAYAVWRRTDFDNIDAARDLDDEFASRIGSAAYTDSVASFLERLATKWGVRSVGDQDGDVREIIHRYDRDGGPPARRFLRTSRQNKALVVLEMKHQHQNDTADTDSEEN